MLYNIIPITSDKPTDCGATCLKMLLNFYGIDVDLDQLIEECHTRIIGCTAKDVWEAGRLHGLDMHTYNTDVDGVIFADRPAIIWWKRRHFCVLCGVDENGSIVICNPDRGRYRMSKSLFRSWYSGVAIFNGVPEDIEGTEIIETYQNIFVP